MDERKLSLMSARLMTTLGIPTALGTSVMLFSVRRGMQAAAEVPPLPVPEPIGSLVPIVVFVAFAFPSAFISLFLSRRNPFIAIVIMMMTYYPVLLTMLMFFS